MIYLEPRIWNLLISSSSLKNCFAFTTEFVNDPMMIILVEIQFKLSWLSSQDSCFHWFTAVFSSICPDIVSESFMILSPLSVTILTRDNSKMLALMNNVSIHFRHILSLSLSCIFCSSILPITLLTQPSYLLDFQGSFTTNALKAFGSKLNSVYFFRHFSSRTKECSLYM